MNSKSFEENVNRFFDSNDSSGKNKNVNKYDRSGNPIWPLVHNSYGNTENLWNDLEHTPDLKNVCIC
jgi:hypothetical protein